MPWQSLLGAGASLLGGTINALSAQNQNNRSMRFVREMYDRQKTDQLAFWNLQNAYNDPAAQMARFRNAGLNPNLIYGQSNTAGAPVLPDVKSPEFQTPQWGSGLQNAGLTYMNSVYDLEMKGAQIDNLRAQNEVLQQDAALRAAQILQTEASTRRSVFDLDFESEFRQFSGDARKEYARQLKVSTDLNINRDARDAAMNSSNLNEAFERMQNMREQRLNMALDRSKTISEMQKIQEEIKNVRESRYLMEREGVLKEMEIELRNKNINPNDPMWQRVVGSFLSWAFDVVTQKGKDVFRFR